MTARHQFTGSLEQEGVAAEFLNGISITGSLDANDLIISGTFVGSSELLDLGTADPGVGGLTFGSASSDGTVQGPWVLSGGGPQTITLTASSSGIKFDHFTFLRDAGNEWKEESEYLNNQHGLKKVNTLEQNLNTGIHRYLLIAVNTSSLITRIKYSTVVINP